ncbi:MAG TPA: conjugative transposon protein TraM [Mucilaginibacter sp.]
MKQKNLTPEQHEKQKKFLLIVPLLILPFMALAFWAFGGGKGNADVTTARNGINTELPSAQFANDKPQDKLSLYDQATRDSAKAQMNAGSGLLTSVRKDSALVNTTTAQASEKQIDQKLAQIKKQLSAQQPINSPTSTAINTPAVNSAEVDRLEKLAQSLKQGSNADPQMKQLDGMITKLLQLQHPELVEAQVQKQAKPEPDSVYKAIRAVIANTQKVVSGASVKLKLMDTITVNHQMIPKGQFLYGLCQVNNQRLILNIKNIRLGTSIVPCDLSVYDLDGMAGINAPDAITEGAVRSGSDNALQSMQFLPMDETLGTQAASAGIETAKTLFSKKVKIIKVKLKAGYPVLLKINKS